MTAIVKVAKLHPAAILPNYAHRGPYGDLAADVSALEGEELAPGDVKALPTGLPSSSLPIMAPSSTIGQDWPCGESAHWPG